MGNFDDLIPKKSGGNFDDLIPKKKESPRADFKSLILSQRGISPIGFLPTSGKELTDIPRVFGRQVIPGARDEKFDVVHQGPFGLGVNLAGIKESKGLIPAPETDYGKTGETAADIAQLFHLGKFGVEALAGKIGGGNSITRFGDIRKKTSEAEALASELLGQAEEARKTAGAMQGGYIDANAEDAVDAERYKQIIESFPEQLKEEASKYSEPNLKNSETLRALIRGKVPSSRWNPKLVMEPERNAAEAGYNSIGQLMTEGRPELAEAMKNYGNVRSAEKQIAPLIRTKQGFIRTKPLMNMFGGDGVPSQAIEVMAEHNPEILNTVDKIKNYSESAQRLAKLKTASKILGYGLLTGGGAKAAWSASKHILGG